MAEPETQVLFQESSARPLVRGSLPQGLWLGEVRGRPGPEWWAAVHRASQKRRTERHSFMAAMEPT